MTEPEALRFFLKLICAVCLFSLAAGWLVLALLYRRIRRRRAARHRAGVTSIAK